MAVTQYKEKLIFQKEVGARLKKLREDSKLTQPDLAEKLIDRKVNVNLDDANGRQTISQLECGARGLTIELASAYADIFNVTLDYIYGRTNDWKPEYKPIKEQFGLSDGSINQLEHLNNNNQKIISTLDLLLNPENSIPFIELLSALYEHSELKNKLLKDKTWLSLKGKDYRETIQHYEKMKRTHATSEDAEYLSLFKVTEITKKVANELKDNSETFADKTLNNMRQKHSKSSNTSQS